MSHRQTASNGLNYETEGVNTLETTSSSGTRLISGTDSSTMAGVGHSPNPNSSNGNIRGTDHVGASDFKRQPSVATIDGGNTGSSPLTQATDHQQPKSTSHQKNQTRLTKALLMYLSLFRVVQPLVSLAAFGTITPVLAYFRKQTIFPTIQATLYLFTTTLACCSLFFGIIYIFDVIFHKPLFWPFTHRHFRQTSKARIGGDLIVCMVFCGLWFLSLVGLVIDTLWVDCAKLTGLEPVFLDNRRSTGDIKTVCQLEKATLGLAVVSWACWMGVLLVLLYGHFWKRRQVIAAHIRGSLSRRQPSEREGVTAGVSSAISPDAGGGQSGSSMSGRNTAAGTGGQHTGCQDREGEVGLTGIICRYDDDDRPQNENEPLFVET